MHDTMKGLQFKRVSDLMREAFKLVQTRTTSFDGTMEGLNWVDVEQPKP
jgi:hypothetical protein